MNCEHKFLNKEERIFKDGSRHIESTCAVCGKYIKFEPTIKSDKELAIWIMPIGKHKGKGLNDIAALDPNYLQWASENLSGNVQRRINEFLKSKI